MQLLVKEVVRTSLSVAQWVRNAAGGGGGGGDLQEEAKEAPGSL